MMIQHSESTQPDNEGCVRHLQSIRHLLQDDFLSWMEDGFPINRQPFSAVETFSVSYMPGLGISREAEKVFACHSLILYISCISCSEYVRSLSWVR